MHFLTNRKNPLSRKYKTESIAQTGLGIASGNSTVSKTVTTTVLNDGSHRGMFRTDCHESTLGVHHQSILVYITIVQWRPDLMCMRLAAEHFSSSQLLRQHCNVANMLCVPSKGTDVPERCFANHVIVSDGERRNTNLPKNAALLMKEISSAKSISSEHKLPVTWMLTWGTPSDSLGCGTVRVPEDPSCFDFVI